MTMILDQDFAAGEHPLAAGANNTSGTASPTRQITTYNAANTVAPDFNEPWIDTWGGVYLITSDGYLNAVPTLGDGNAAFFKTLLVRPLSEAILNQRVRL